MSETISQLSKQIQGMCTLLSDLRAEVNSLKATSHHTATPDHGQTCDRQTSDQTETRPPSYAQVLTNAIHRDGNTVSHVPVSDRSSDVRRELRELLERDKRRESVIIRGLSASSPAALVTKFGEMTEKVMGFRVELTAVVPIPNHPDLWRAKIMCNDDRKRVLDGAKKLCGTEYKDVYIRRDLTYAQRGELRQRRLEAGATSGMSARSAPRQDRNGADSVPTNRVPQTVNENEETIPKSVASPEPTRHSGGATGSTQDPQPLQKN